MIIYLADDNDNLLPHFSALFFQTLNSLSKIDG